jgi:hypothetical protein
LTENSPYKDTVTVEVVVKNGVNNKSLPTTPSLSQAQKATLGILCYINLINYMDRFTLAGE